MVMQFISICFRNVFVSISQQKYESFIKKQNIFASVNVKNTIFFTPVPVF